MKWLTRKVEEDDERVWGLNLMDPTQQKERKGNAEEGS